MLALVGCGRQAVEQLRATILFRTITEVRVWSLSAAESVAWVEVNAAEFSGIRFKVCDSVQNAVKQADIITTVTPSRTPLVMAEWVSPGTHINAIGADAPGKQELDSGLILNNSVFIDHWDQASHSGEINVAVSGGKFTQAMVKAELGQVILNGRSPRQSPTEITIFDSTGLAIQDIVVAKKIFEKLESR